MSENNVEYAELQLSTQVKDRFPRIVIIIMVAEFCERFSFASLKAFLALYLRSKLGYSEDGATEIYHIFCSLVYCFPILGGIVADNYLGKYRTILYLMFFYLFGNILLASTAIPPLGLPVRISVLLALLIISIGTGGIKPCALAFGGDQFKLPQQERFLAVYFSVQYFIATIGASIAKTVLPILRTEVHCFGDKDCYALAFGVPGIVLIWGIVIFMSPRKKYIMKKPEGNVMIDFVKCIFLGFKNRILRRDTQNDAHWLDSTRRRYDQRFIMDVKKTLSILVLFSLLPVFFSLLNQMGSRWTLQAAKMDGRFGFFTAKPDQMQVINPIVILLSIPILTKYIYPFLEKRNILKNPLHKLTLGGILGGVAFIPSGFVEIYLSTTYPQLPQQGYSQIRIFNGNPCSVSLYSSEHNITYTIPSLSHFVKKDISVNGAENITIDIDGTCILPMKRQFLLEENCAVSFFIAGDTVRRYKDAVEKNRSGFPMVRFLVSGDVEAKNITLIRGSKGTIETYISTGVSKLIELFADTYSIQITDSTEEGDSFKIKCGNKTQFVEARNQSNVANVSQVPCNLIIESGGIYAIILYINENELNYNVIVITEANSITMAWLIPQFVIISVAEVLLCVTGYEVAFKESPASMKAAMTAVWLLVQAAGDVIIIIFTRVFVSCSQETQFFINAGSMFVAITVFHFLARRYRFGTDEDDRPQKQDGGTGSELIYLRVKQTEDC